MKIFLIIYLILGYFACGLGCYLYSLQKTKKENLTREHRLYVDIDDDSMFLVFLFFWPVCFLDVIIYYIQKNYKEPKEGIKKEEETTHNYIHISQNPNMYYVRDLRDILYPTEGEVCILPDYRGFVYRNGQWVEF